MNDQDEENARNFESQRAALRRQQLAVRRARSPAAREAASAAVAARLYRRLEPPSARMAARTLGFCWPIRGEIDCRPGVLRLLAAGWQACMPVVVAAAAPMCFRAWWPQAPMSADRYGIPIPATAAAAPPAVLLVPLLAVDAAGYRLGYGGGYFDRTLATLMPRPLTIGIGYAADRIATLHPAAHDIPLDGALDEDGWTVFSSLDFPAEPAEDGGP